MPKARRAFVEKGVADNASAKVQEAVEKLKPDLVSLDEFKRRGEQGLTLEGRRETAKPFHIPPPFDCELMIAPAQGMKFYERLFGGLDALFDGSVKTEDVRPDLAFVKEFVLSCVVTPEGFDLAALDLVLNNNPSVFMMLSAYCLNVTKMDPSEAISARLGMIDTEAQELFFAVLDGSMSMPTPA